MTVEELSEEETLSLTKLLEWRIKWLPERITNLREQGKSSNGILVISDPNEKIEKEAQEKANVLEIRLEHYKTILLKINKKTKL